MLFIGIDPGVTGAICALNRRGRIVHLRDVPRSHSGPGGRLALDHVALVRTVAACVGQMPAGYVVATIEHVWGGAGQSGQFQFGESYGALIAAFASAGIEVHKVAPVKWMHAIGLPRGKASEYAALEKARALWPDDAVRFAEKSHHNRADAALIAEWSRRETAAGSALWFKGVW